jgi:hypothetical protein
VNHFAIKSKKLFTIDKATLDELKDIISVDKTTYAHEIYLEVKKK